ncbi:MAG: hypothetical protein CMG25_01540 [Candidatus Marinimicrobia bacterium]|nr:hypothetical protein [Candidatus Neomarinimicrobiota bacterium]|tara:strand:+ start:6636 stop:6977 length:342 start_codon:yes stop_codon:yes gene_type:complete
MVRIDKIIYMITCFKSLSDDLEDSQYSLPKENILIDDSVIRVLSRLGVVLEKFNQKELIQSIPLGRESFLLSNTMIHSEETCKAVNPCCDSCHMNSHCDYYNNKNSWVCKESN